MQEIFFPTGKIKIKIQIIIFVDDFGFFEIKIGVILIFDEDGDHADLVLVLGVEMLDVFDSLKARIARGLDENKENWLSLEGDFKTVFDACDIESFARNAFELVFRVGFFEWIALSASSK